MKVPYMKIVAGDFYPPWYYGFAYRMIDRHMEVWMPIPINFIVRARERVVLWWHKMRGKPSYIDQMIEQGIQYKYREIYERAYSEIYYIFDRDLDFKVWEKYQEITNIKNRRN